MLTHLFAILGLALAVIVWHLVQVLAHGPEGATACGGSNDGSGCGCKDEARGSAERPQRLTPGPGHEP